MKTKALDIGCSSTPKNPFSMEEIYGIDVREDIDAKIYWADLAVEPIPFENEFFDAVSAFDFIEHVPRVIYMPNRRFCFVELMNEIYRVLKVGGRFLSFTPAFAAPPAWTDPTHVNIITEETFPLYFDYQNRGASAYGFNGYFQIVDQQWHENKIHLITEMVKVVPVDHPK
jgi:SAM-dependent methyltransferase